MGSKSGSGPLRSPAVRCAIRSVVAGVLLGCAVGLGAYNHWGLALGLGVPLAIATVFVAPRPRRIDGALQGGHSSQQIPVTVEALTRSSLDAANVQPTLVTATISPPNDTEYRTRWLSAMPKGMVANLLSDADNRLPASFIPPRPPESLPYQSGGKPVPEPEFGDNPATSTLLYPVIIVAVAAALFLGVGGGWHFSVSLPSTGSVSFTGDGPSDNREERMAALIEHVSTLGPTASSNVLSLELEENGSDRAYVLDPATGESLNVWYSESSDEWYEPSRSSTPFRSAKTFTLGEVAGMPLNAITDAMAAALPAESRDFQSLKIERADNDQPVLVTANFGEDYENEETIQADTSGKVAAWFQPGDFDAAFAQAALAIGETGLPASAPLFTRFEIRGTDSGTPTMRAGTIQNSGGVLMDFSDLTRNGSLAIVPGSFPVVRSTETRSRDYTDGAVAFDDISAQTFDAVRDDAMRRHSVDAFDRNRVDIQTSSTYVVDRYQTVIMVEVGPDSPIDYYTVDGRFIESD
ncbi:hypothetical protein [Williamsia soli]|uniref:hypothetical protein n=1 Tax=Williamsia soli TaxID=364929 RepID=UPI001A9F4CC0|nr:hypothetical protein [Williamsia soli]